MKQPIKKLDMNETNCPICRIQMKRDGNEVVCPKCGFTSPIILVKHRKGETE